MRYERLSTFTRLHRVVLVVAIPPIKCNYKSIERNSETEYMCGSGALMSGVTLKGQVVKLAQ